MPFNVIHVSGSAYECGLQYGTQAKNAIAQTIDVYLDIFKHYTGDDRAQIFEKASQYLPYIQAFDKSLVEEMRGIAEGADVPLEAILALNSRTELMSSAPIRGECTVLGAMSPATEDDNAVFLAQNWDWLEITNVAPIILHSQQTGKPEIFALAEAGQLGKVGMNNAGFGFCLNWLACDYRRMGIPVHIVTRALLNCASAYAVVDLLYNHVRGAAANYMVAHRDGFLMDFETTPDTLDYFEPTDGTLSHTNHFESARFRPIDTGVRISGDSFPRLQRMRRLLRENHGSINLETIKMMLKDQAFAPFGICTCPDPNAPNMDRWSTLSSVIFDLKNETLWITQGNPAEQDYISLQFGAEVTA